MSTEYNGQGKMKIISAEELQTRLQQGEALTIINVLASKYFNDCHIATSINIPTDDLKEKTAHWEKNKEIILYCATPTCTKSEEAYRTLEELGFTNLHEYPGGIKEWYRKGFETIGACALDYLHDE